MPWVHNIFSHGENYVLEGNGFFISYNPDTSRSPFAKEDDGEETALCYNGRYDILVGDFREAYERLVPEGLEACKKFYNQQSAYADSDWSTSRSA